MLWNEWDTRVSVRVANTRVTGADALVEGKREGWEAAGKSEGQTWRARIVKGWKPKQHNQYMLIGTVCQGITAPGGKKVVSGE